MELVLDKALWHHDLCRWLHLKKSLIKFSQLMACCCWNFGVLLLDLCYYEIGVFVIDAIVEWEVTLVAEILKYNLEVELGSYASALVTFFWCYGKISWAHCWQTEIAADDEVWLSHEFSAYIIFFVFCFFLSCLRSVF